MGTVARGGVQKKEYKQRNEMIPIEYTKPFKRSVKLHSLKIEFFGEAVKICIILSFKR